MNTTEKQWRCGGSIIATLNGTTLTISGYGEMEDYTKDERLRISIIRDALQVVEYFDDSYGSSDDNCYISINNKPLGIKGVTSFDDVLKLKGFIDKKITGYYTESNGLEPDENDSYRDYYINTRIYAIEEQDTTPWDREFLTEVIIEKGITKIGAYAFSGFVGLKEVSFPDTLETIGKGAFQNCKSLTSIKMPNSVRKIQTKAFYNCSALKTIDLSEAKRIEFEDEIFGENLTALHFLVSSANTLDEYSNYFPIDNLFISNKLEEDNIDSLILSREVTIIRLNEEIEKLKNKKENIPTIDVQHQPKQTTDFLSEFNSPNGLKYLTHDFDKDIPNYALFMKDIKTILNKAKNEKNITPSVWSLINGFVKKDTTWTSFDGQENNFSWSDKEVEEWVTSSKLHPLKHADFQRKIEKFKNSTRVSPPQLKSIIDEIISKNQYTINIEQKDTETADFYTNVNQLRSAITLILEMMNAKHRNNGNSKIQILKRSEAEEHNYKPLYIEITQIDSFSNSSINDAIERLNKNPNAGDFGSIKKHLHGLCDWSVESTWNNEPWRWNILKDKHIDSREKLGLKPDGFKHILKFYRK